MQLIFIYIYTFSLVVNFFFRSDIYFDIFQITKRKFYTFRFHEMLNVQICITVFFFRLVIQKYFFFLKHLFTYHMSTISSQQMSTQSSGRWISNIDAQHILTLVLKLSRVDDYKSADVDTVLRKVSLTSPGVPHIHPTLSIKW